MNLLITGLAQGDDPAGGVGVAMALRQGFGNRLHLMGQDYSSRAVGLHHPIFDEVIVHRPWGEFDTAALRHQFTTFLTQGGWVISTIDLEGYWLAQHFGGWSQLLSPPSTVYEAIAKPPRFIPALEDLEQPAALPISAGATALHAFLRRSGWRAWLKGPFHDALRVPSWEGLDALVARLRRYWPFSGAHLQAHVDGVHEAIAFAAHEGQLLDAIWIVKNDMTAAGKTTAASRHTMRKTDRVALADYVARLGWNGGGEIELIRDQSGKLWLIEINSRFPAWIAGAALLGINLPGELLEAASGACYQRGGQCQGFVRVQKEVGTRSGFDLLPPLMLNPDEPLDSSKVAFNIHEIAHHISDTVGLPVPDPAPFKDEARLPDLTDIPLDNTTPTPVVHLLRTQLRHNLAQIAQTISDTPQDAPAITIAYSIKTNPDQRVLAEVRAAGFGAEVIGIDELRHALACGFSAESVVVTGTGKAADLARICALSRGPVFADSLAELEVLMLQGADRPLGLRLRPAGFRSRFGIPLEHAPTLDRLYALLESAPDMRPLAVHFHLPQAILGTKVWRAVAEAVVDDVKIIADAVNRRVLWLDLGGGFYPADFLSELSWIAGAFRNFAARRLSGLERIIIEPGRAVVQNAFAVESVVLEVREENGCCAAVVDISIADLPEAGHYPHRSCRWQDGHWVPLSQAGQGRVLGRTCMEDDVLIRGLDLTAVGIGDRLLILDAGSYDRSMAYDFGRGRYH